MVANEVNGEMRKRRIAEDTQSYNGYMDGRDSRQKKKYKNEIGAISKNEIHNNSDS